MTTLQATDALFDTGEGTGTGRGTGTGNQRMVRTAESRAWEGRRHVRRACNCEGDLPILRHGVTKASSGFIKKAR